MCVSDYSEVVAPPQSGGRSWRNPDRGSAPCNARRRYAPPEGKCAAQSEPIRLHPKNPHCSLFRGKAVALVTSGEHYGAAMNAEGVPATSFGIKRNTLVPEPGRFVAPWAPSGGEPPPDCVNIETGAIASPESFRHGGGDRILRSPEFRDGIALRLERTAR